MMAREQGAKQNTTELVHSRENVQNSRLEFEDRRRLHAMRQENRREWIAFFRANARFYTTLAEESNQRADQLEQEVE